MSQQLGSLGNVALGSTSQPEYGLPCSAELYFPGTYQLGLGHHGNIEGIRKFTAHIVESELTINCKKTQRSLLNTTILYRRLGNCEVHLPSLARIPWSMEAGHLSKLGHCVCHAGNCRVKNCSKARALLPPARLSAIRLLLLNHSTHPHCGRPFAGIPGNQCTDWFQHVIRW